MKAGLPILLGIGVLAAIAIAASSSSSSAKTGPTRGPIAPGARACPDGDPLPPFPPGIGPGDVSDDDPRSPHYVATSPVNTMPLGPGLTQWMLPPDDPRSLCGRAHPAPPAPPAPPGPPAPPTPGGDPYVPHRDTPNVGPSTGPGGGGGGGGGGGEYVPHAVDPSPPAPGPGGDPGPGRGGEVVVQGFPPRRRWQSRS